MTVKVAGVTISGVESAPDEGHENRIIMGIEAFVDLWSGPGSLNLLVQVTMYWNVQVGSSLWIANQISPVNSAIHVRRQGQLFSLMSPGFVSLLVPLQTTALTLLMSLTKEDFEVCDQTLVAVDQ